MRKREFQAALQRILTLHRTEGQPGYDQAVEAISLETSDEEWAAVQAALDAQDEQLRSGALERIPCRHKNRQRLSLAMGELSVKERGVGETRIRGFTQYTESCADCGKVLVDKRGPAANIRDLLPPA